MLHPKLQNHPNSTCCILDEKLPNHEFVIMDTISHYGIV